MQALNKLIDAMKSEQDDVASGKVTEELVIEAGA